MTILDRVKAHAQPDKKRTVEVPEWGEPAVVDAKGKVTVLAKPLVIHFSMVKLQEHGEAIAAANGDQARAQVELICMKARDEAGEPLFKRIDVLYLLENANADVLARIYNAMCERQAPAAIEGN